MVTAVFEFEAEKPVAGAAQIAPCMVPGVYLEQLTQNAAGRRPRRRLGTSEREYAHHSRPTATAAVQPPGNCPNQTRAPNP